MRKSRKLMEATIKALESELELERVFSNALHQATVGVSLLPLPEMPTFEPIPFVLDFPTFEEVFGDITTTEMEVK